MKKKFIHLMLSLLCAVAPVCAQSPAVDMQARAKELQNLKWGMFVCWSFSTFSEKEWTPGIADVSYFKATAVDTDQWARTAKEAQLKELLTNYGPIEYIWFDHAVGNGGLSHSETIAFCKSLQPGCFIGFNHGDQHGADIRLGEMGKPGPLTDNSGAGYNKKEAPSENYLLAEFTYPIQPRRPKGAMWFYSHPDNEDACHPAEKLYQDYLGAVKFGNIFSLDVGPDYNGKLRAIDIRTLREVGGMIRKGKAIE